MKATFIDTCTSGHRTVFPLLPLTLGAHAQELYSTVCVYVSVCAVSYTHLTLPTILRV